MSRGVLLRKDSVLMVEIAIVVTVVPVTIGVPAVRIFVPPAVLVFIAVRAGFREFVAPVFSLRALRSVMLDRFMKLVVRLTDALLTILVCADNRRADEKQSRQKRRSRKRVMNPLCFEFHDLSKSEITCGAWEGRSARMTRLNS